MLRGLLYRVFRSTYGAIAFVALVAAGGILYYGPALGWGDVYPLAGWPARLGIAGGVLAAALLGALAVHLMRRRRRAGLDAALAAQTAPDPAAEAAEAVAGELGEMRAKLRAALATLRRSGLGRRSLHELPWYVMIGPPGAGKTTAIVNSGLKFPLAEAFGRSALGGVGGTRNCDWWFTDAAVLIDTAGRYTTQDSGAQEDDAGWTGFLALLRKHRKCQPINGALVAVSLADLSLSDEVTQAAHAQAIRRRLNELRDRLGVRFPVYVLFTKGDLIAGFAEFFETLGREAREQVWGFTLPLEPARGAAPAPASPAAAFDAEFSALLARLNTQSLERMQQETDPQRRSLIAGFPGQVASVCGVARDFLAEVFLESRYDARHRLRGVYFTSGTQEGTPIDRLMMGMARTFGIGRQAIGTGRGTGRSYFLTRLFERVVFREAGLVAADDRVERRYRATRAAAIAATVLVALGAAGVWTRSYLANAAMIDAAQGDLARYRDAAAQVPSGPVADSDLPSVVPMLDILRALPVNAARPPGDRAAPPGSGYGLYQGRVLGNDARLAYRAALNQQFLPRLLLRLEDQIQGNINDADGLYEALKVYLMLGGQGPLNPDLIAQWMTLDWQASFPGPARQQLRDDLATHLGALVSQPMAEVGLNGPLVEKAQALLLSMPMAQRIYNGILASPRALALPKWRVTDVGGPAVTRALTRSSGKPLNEGIEGIFTWRGFNEVFLGEALGVAKRIQSEAWVLGAGSTAEVSEPALLALSRDVLDLYYNDYVARYEGILSDVDIIPMDSLGHAVEVTNLLSGPTSPIVNLLLAISDETRLTEDRGALATIGGGGLREGAKAAAAVEATSLLSVQAQAFVRALQGAQEAAGEAPRAPGAYVEERFAWLHDMVARKDGQPSQLDDLVRALEQVYREMSKLAFAGVATAPADPEASALFQLTQAAARLPGPMQRWVAQIATGIVGDRGRRQPRADQREMAVAGAAVLRPGDRRALSVQPPRLRRRRHAGLCPHVRAGRAHGRLLRREPGQYRRHRGQALGLEAGGRRRPRHLARRAGAVRDRGRDPRGLLRGRGHPGRLVPDHARGARPQGRRRAAGDRRHRDRLQPRRRPARAHRRHLARRRGLRAHRVRARGPGDREPVAARRAVGLVPPARRGRGAAHQRLRPHPRDLQHRRADRDLPDAVGLLAQPVRAAATGPLRLPQELLMAPVPQDDAPPAGMVRHEAVPPAPAQPVPAQPAPARTGPVPTGPMLTAPVPPAPAPPGFAPPGSARSADPAPPGAAPPPGGPSAPGRAFGAFGKMPAQGDFVRMGLPRDFVEPWDRWLQSGLVAARDAMGEGWREAYFSAPIWRFHLAPGLAGGAPAMGVLTPSVDRVGRQFPMTLARTLPLPRPDGGASVPGGVVLDHLMAGEAFARLEAVALAALEDAMTRDALGDRLARVGPARDTRALRLTRGPGGLAATGAMPGTLAPALAAALAADGFRAPSVWSAETGGRLRLMVCEGLPAGDRMRGLFDMAAAVWQAPAGGGPGAAAPAAGAGTPAPRAGGAG